MYHHSVSMEDTPGSIPMTTLKNFVPQRPVPTAKSTFPSDSFFIAFTQIKK